MFNQSLTSRRSFALVVSLMVTLAINAGAAFAQTTAFTYQGRLTDNASPATGNYDFEFKLFDNSNVGSGTQHGPTIQQPNVSVTNGVFTVQLNFASCSSCFNGADRYLEISVKPSSGLTFTTLSPRQQVNSTPYAIKSSSAAAADGLSVACVNCVTSSQIASVSGSAVTGTIPVSSLPAGSENYIQNTTSQQASSNFNISGNGLIGGKLGIGTSSPGSRLFVQANTASAGGNTADFFNPAIGPNFSHIHWGTTGDWFIRSAANSGKVILQDNGGNVGIGTTTPSARLAVQGDGIDVLLGSAGCGSPTAAIGFGTMSGCTDFALGANISAGAAAGTFLNRPAGRSLHFRENNGPDQMTITPGGNVGIGVDPQSVGPRLQVQGNLSGGTFRATDPFGTGVRGEATDPTIGAGVSGSGASFGVNGSTTSGTGVFGSSVSGTGVLGSSSTGVGVYGVSSNGNDGLVGESRVANRSGVYGFTTHVDGCGGCFANLAGGLALGVTGTARVSVLEITGGSDLAEHFEVVERVKPGMVVAIDPKNAGKLSVARGAYNRRAAGVISGGKNLSAGMVLPDVSGAKQSVPVALSGRVWVFCDATRNPVKPGDLLTTSQTPGHAMKVTNYAKAQGAIIGKAMTGLKAGRGLVLVLVSLQ